MRPERWVPLREYETVFILHPSSEEARVEEEIEGVRQIILAGSGEIVQVDRWGRRRMAYGIRKVNEGIYTLIRFRSGPGVLTDLDRRYRLREDILRHLTVVAQGPAMSLEPPRREMEGVQPMQEGAGVAPPAGVVPVAAPEAAPISAETPAVKTEPEAESNLT
jgi:small subunit ribosomal protein S6